MLIDPIAALATPPGRSAIAVVRVSGEGALDVAARVIEGFRADPPRVARLAPFRASDGDVIDRGLYTVFREPQSYTGEDLIELACHGGMLAPARLLAALHAAGARPALPGEFTRRAVARGKLDLVQAEAVSDLIDATVPAQARAALHQLEGGLSRRFLTLRAALIDAQALLSYDIDFPEEDDGPVAPARIVAALADVATQLDRLLATAPAGERLRSGALVVLAGRPNAGKSSLFNALLGIERALVTELPGTTRDAIEAHTDFGGWPIRLADTAGLWESESRLDQLGVEVSRRYLAAADLVLLCVEAGRPLGEDEQAVQEGYPTLVVRTKADLVRDAVEGEARDDPEAVKSSAPEIRDMLRISVFSGHGLDLLRDHVAAHLFGDGRPFADLEPLLTRERHREALERARGAVTAAVAQLEPGGEGVLAAHHLLDATTALDELLGTIDVDEVLGRVFGSFCVGK